MVKMVKEALIEKYAKTYENIRNIFLYIVGK